MKKNIILSLSLLVASCILSVGSVVAQTCTTQYGGTSYGTECQPIDLTINKTVKHPTDSVFVENIVADGATYSSGSEVLFRLTIKNSSGETFNPVTVTDVFPEHLFFVAGPGTYDSASRTLTFTLENLVAGESRTVEVLAKVVNVASNTNLFCENNYSRVTAPARPNGDDDTAQVCVQTKVLGATTLPAAGFNDFMLLMPFAGLGLAGLALFKVKR